MLFFAASVVIYDGALSAEPPEVPKECVLEGHTVVAAAAKKGFSFSVESEKDASCQIKKNGELLVVSAGSQLNGSCYFSIFVPQSEKDLPFQRITIKTEDSGLIHIQKATESRTGARVLLTALKGQTLQFRIFQVTFKLGSSAECKPENVENLL